MSLCDGRVLFVCLSVCLFVTNAYWWQLGLTVSAALTFSFCFCFCGILASPSEVSQRGGSTSAAQISSNWLVVRSWSNPVRESPWILKVTDSSRGLFVGRSCVYTVDNDEPAEWWIVLVNQVVESSRFILLSSRFIQVCIQLPSRV